MEWTKERHEAVKARCAEATPGPWATYDGGWRNHARAAVNPWRFMHVIVPIDGPPKYSGHVASDFIAELKDAQDDGARRVEVDAAFIAAARTDLPDALAEIERLTSKFAGTESAAAESDKIMVAISEQAAQIEKAQHDLRVKASLYEMALKDIDRLSGELAKLLKYNHSIKIDVQKAEIERLKAERDTARDAAAKAKKDYEATLANLMREQSCHRGTREKLEKAEALRPGLTEEQALDLAKSLEPYRREDGISWRDRVAAALLRASRGAAAPGDVSIPRAILERLAKAAASDPDARETRWAAERILQRADLAAEPARTDPLCARVLAETTQTDANRGAK